MNILGESGPEYDRILLRCVGSAYALGENDWVFPSFREMGACYMRGVPLRDIYLYWMGDERGQTVTEDVHIFPVSIPVGSHPLHAAGAAWAAKLQREGERKGGQEGDPSHVPSLRDQGGSGRP